MLKPVSSLKLYLDLLVAMKERFLLKQNKQNYFWVSDADNKEGHLPRCHVVLAT